jgi:hypothetical protein
VRRTPGRDLRLVEHAAGRRRPRDDRGQRPGGADGAAGGRGARRIGGLGP